jgi:adenylate cyclase
MKTRQRSGGVVSYRISLVVAIPLFVVFTGALVATNSYLSARESIRKLADTLFAQVADQAAGQARAHLRQAPPAVDSLTLLLADDPVVSARPTDGLARRLLAVLRANGGFAWVSFSDVDGTFTGAQRTVDGTLVVNQTRLENGKTIRDEHMVADDGAWKLLRHNPDADYDPRARPWYRKAVAAKKRTWMDPYVFYDQGVPGMTCAAPVYDAAGALRGVVTADFTLNSFGDFVATLRPSPNARVFIYSASGSILAHPSLRVVEKTDSRDEGRLVTKDDVDDAVLRQYFRTPAATRFDVEGARWFSATRAFEDEGLEWSVAAVAPESDFMGEVDRTTRIALAFSLVVVLLAVLMGASMANWVSAPLVQIAREMERVGRFELEDAAPPFTVFKELAVIHGALATMKRGLMNFAVYVPRDLVRAVLQSGQRAELGGRTKQLTVLFSDLAGFTTLSESMTPDALVKLLGGYFDAMTRVISARQGTIDKFIGDAIMAFWNAPGDVADHAVLACEAALACQRKLDELKKSDPALRGVSARIGVSTGDVLVGNIGSPGRMNYTVMGDTVNLAARLEGLGKVYGTPILVSAACREAAKGRIVMRPVDVVAVKGKTQGVKVYEPLALVSEPSVAGESSEAGEAGGANHGVARAIAALAERAMDAYLARRFGEAVTLFEELLGMLPGDLAATTLRDRARRYEREPPPEEWSGAHVMTEK